MPHRFFTQSSDCNIKIRSPLLFFLYVAVSFLIRCDHEKGPPLWILLTTDIGEAQIAFDYAGRSLVSEGVYDTGYFSQANSRDEFFDISFPSLRLHNGVICLFSHSRFYFENEAGPRFSYCDADFLIVKDEIESFLHAVRYLTPMAYPNIDHPRFSLSVLTASSLRKETGDIFFSLDGFKPSILARKDLEGREGAFRYGAPVHASDCLPFSRRFPLTGFHLLVSGTGIFLAYPMPGSQRFATLRIKDAKAIRRVREGFVKLSNIVQSQMAQPVTLNAPVAVTEIAFGDQNTPVDEFIEISSFGDAPVTARLSIQYDSGTIVEEYHILPRSVILFSRRGDGAFRFRTAIQAGNDSNPINYSLADYALSGATSHRSISREAALSMSPGSPIADLSGSVECLSTEICGSPGIHPEYAFQGSGLPSGGDPSVPRCSIDDLRLSEINPFGLITSGNRADPINISGKFIEFESLVRCSTDSIIFFVGGIPLDPASIRLGRGDSILFTANASYFGPGVSREVSSLRQMSPGDPVISVDLMTGARRTLRNPNSDLYLYGSRADDGYRFAVHSLVYDQTGENYHEPESSGLRPDFAQEHAMSPGSANPLLRNRPVPSLSEILPQGSYDASGASVPEDEFFELRASGATSTNSMYILEIRRVSDGTIYRYRVINTIETDSDRISFMHAPPTCFANSNRIVSNRVLCLPNSPAEYALMSSGGILLETVRLSSYDYDRIDSPPRKSFIRIDNTSIFRPADHPLLASALCAGNTLAAPGFPDGFVPFLQFVSDGVDYRRFQLFSPAATERVRISAGRNVSGPEVIGFFEFANRSFYDFRPSIAGYRILGGFEPVDYPTHSSHHEFFAGGPRLVFQTEYPSPRINESEWLRICSPNGFSLADAGTGLYIRDSFSMDRVVPYLQRFSSTPLPLIGDTISLPPGGCALLVDPDYSPSTQIIPLRPEDTALWTVETSATIGNGISSGEGLLLFRFESDLSKTPFCSLGIPDTPHPFSLMVATGQRVERAPGTVYDSIENYEVIQ